MSFFIRSKKNQNSSRGGGAGGRNREKIGGLPKKLTESVGGSGKGGNGRLNDNKFRGGKQQRGGRGRGSGGLRRGLKRKHEDGPPQPSKKKLDDEEITSEEDEELSAEEADFRVPGEDEEDDPEETPQQARIRLAKEQISQLKKRVKQRGGGGEDDDDEEEEEDENEAVRKLLRDSELIERGKVLRRIVPLNYENKSLNMTVLVRNGKILKSPITGLASNSKHLFASTKSGHILQFTASGESSSEAPRKHIRLPPPPISSIACTDKYLAAANPSQITIIDPTTLQKLATLSSSRNPIHLSILSDTLYSSHKDRTVKVWNLQEQSYVESLFGHQEVPSFIDCIYDNRVLTCGGFDKTLRYWKIEEETHLVYNWDEYVIDCVKILSGGYFVAGSCNGSLGLFSFGKKKALCTIKDAHGTEHGNGRWITAIGGIGDFVASGSDAGVVKVWRVESRKLVFVRDVEVGDGIVVGIIVNTYGGSDNDEEIDRKNIVKLTIAVSTEMRNGRWSGRVGKVNRVIVVE